MELLDPATGQALPNDAIQRILFVANTTHVYNIPPMASTKGHNAASWTADPKRHIFTARLRVIETAYESPGAENKLKVDAVLEDASTGQLFAAAPYTAAAVVEPVLDSSRFFALTVRDPQGRRALLGIGFEDRSEAFDLAVALQEARKALGWETDPNKPTAAAKEQEDKRDYSLKDGETITVSFGSGSKFGRRKNAPAGAAAGAAPTNLQAFALPPPPPGPSGAKPAGSGGFSLPPPPSGPARQKQSAKDLGFDDGQFGEFA